MSNALSTFTFAPGMNLRALTRDEAGGPWFVASDVCRALEIQNVAVALPAIDPEDKHMESIGLRGKAPWLINESGLYSLILKSRKPEAKVFKRWVTSVVLPAIRKDGAHYSLRTTSKFARYALICS